MNEFQYWEFSMHQVNWKNGQLLLPQHFNMMGDHHVALIAQRSKLQGEAFYGFADLVIDRDLCAMGVIRFKVLKAIDVCGQYYELHNNLSIEECLLDELLKTSNKEVYLHVFSAKPKEISVVDHQIEIKSYKAVLSSAPTMDGSVSSFPFCKISMLPSGKCELNALAKTPILSFYNSLFWESYKDQIKSIVLSIEARIKNDLLNHISASKYVMAQTVLMHSYRIDNCMMTMEQGGRSSPDYLFQQLYDFYLCFCNYIDDEPITELTYQHNTCCKCLNDLVEHLGFIAKYEVKEASLLAFNKGMRYIELKEIPEIILGSNRVYLLIQELTKDFNIDDIKVASSERLPVVHQKALPGLQLTHEKETLFSHIFDANTQIYKVEAGREWDNVIHYGNMAMTTTPQLENAKIFLYSPDYKVERSAL
ncbi:MULTISPECIES: type VI secretion system baseplate subunit TssK [Cysteiniphilum]|uniref:Type VI secretion system baseplate subunit TssK n=1 Tax=Cysteiniphilum litorale TaxID=2056700 RepID=A0A8J3E839_9GAMM|nr:MULTISPECIES: type VI secretion system baseplate subunit TssK [Cysteiniphilum]GGF95478.1 hypothetical protein GCM10010995_10900 [Cysteiniphilum litorale]